MRYLLALVLLLAPAAAVSAQEADGIKAEILRELDDTATKLMSLAEAIPAETYAWRPADGIRSVRESLLHVASGNYFFSTRLGAEIPEGIDPQQLEATVTDRDAAIETLQASFDHLRAAIEAVDADQLEAAVPWFGGSENTTRGVMMFTMKHATEHLGQMIAYARMNGIAPPWSS